MYINKIQEICEKDNITITSLGKYVEIDRSTLWKYINGYLPIPLKHLNSLCNYFDISLDFVFSLSNNKKYKNYKKEIDKHLFSVRLKEFRKANKITQAKLSEVLQCSNSAISEYEHGKRLISTSHLYTICKKYNISADYLLGKIKVKGFQS